MTHTPFNKTLDRALRGRLVRVREEGETYRGWVERVHHGRGSVVLHDVTTANGEDLAGVFVRNPSVVEVVKPGKRIEYRDLDKLQSHPEHNGGITPKDRVLRDCYRNRSVGSYPVVREDGTILNGHKRIAAAEVAGLNRVRLRSSTSPTSRRTSCSRSPTAARTPTGTPTTRIRHSVSLPNEFP